MPDGAIQQDYTYRHAKRDKTAPLIMIAGPPGSGKTYTALRLARGMVGPAGKIFLADTDNGRALFYADEFEFEHLNLHEPFRPVIFEEAAIRAQKQGAAVLIIDNFMAEHAGPGGLLDYHQEINVRMAGGPENFARIESTKMLAWIEPKTQHKRMRERLYQLNMPVILCCGAERKIAMVKQTDGKDKGKTIPVDQGLVPICGADIPWAMTISLMLPDVARPGVPVPIKALLPALQPIIHLDRPLDEATGAAIAAWARGEQPLSPDSQTAKTVAPERAQAEAPSPPPPKIRRQAPDEATIEEGAKALAEKFLGTADRAAHLRLVDDAELRQQIEWLRKHRRALFDREVNPAIKASWQRTEPNKAPAQQGALM